MVVLAQRVADNTIIMPCDFCGKDIRVTASRRASHKHFFCNSECSKAYRKKDKVRIICPICKAVFYRKKSQVDKMKHPEYATCSLQCAHQIKQLMYAGEFNHQYGLTGSKNASWKSDVRDRQNHYKLIRMETHPFRDNANFVPEHRLIAEKYLLTEQNSIEIDGKLYLKPECIVHHTDFNKKNNALDNLYVFDNESLHTLFHNLHKANRVSDLENFFNYYQHTYVEKICNYQWLYRAYIEYNLSINQISKLFNVPYSSVKTEVYKFKLDIEKKKRKENNMILNLIVQDLLNFKPN